MRRMAYVAVVLVMLALLGLGLLRVTSSSAYVARVRLMQIKPGMSRAQVRRVMTDLAPSHRHWIEDEWQIGQYTLSVRYVFHEPENEGGKESDIVETSGLSSRSPHEHGDRLDRFLEYLGMPKVWTPVEF
jgi:D-lyxose ketol-isomerase